MIRIRENNKCSAGYSAALSFQIGLHKDEIEVLEYIMKTLQCGHISKSQDKINYFVIQ